MLQANHIFFWWGGVVFNFTDLDLQSDTSGPFINGLDNRKHQPASPEESLVFYRGDVRRSSPRIFLPSATRRLLPTSSALELVVVVIVHAEKCFQI